MATQQGHEIKFEIITPSVLSPADGRSNITCGNGWEFATEIRKSYRGVDRFSELLPPIHEQWDAVAENLNISIPILVTQRFQQNLTDAISSASEMLSSYKAEGNIDDANFKAIKMMIDRANHYLNSAISLQNWWKDYSNDHYVQNNKIHPIGRWPLEQESVGSGCDNKFYPQKVDFYAGPQIGTVKMHCPKPFYKNWHDRDRSVFRKLMSAAIHNCRCAQEAAATVAVYNKNKKYYYSSGAGAGLSIKYAPKKSATTTAPDLGSGIAREEDDPPDFTGEMDHTSISRDATVSKKKKKDSSALIIGAAAIGLIILRK